MTVEKTTEQNTQSNGVAENYKFPVFELDTQQSVPYDGRFMQPGALVDNPNPMMPLVDAVGTRRTARSYRKEKVDEETFEWLILHSMHAPTACNEQQWKVIYIDDQEILNDLQARGSASFLNNVQQAFLLCYNKESDNLEWADHVQSGAAFITTFQLMAHSIGVGSCWLGHLPNKREVSRMFGVHRYYEPIALVTFGYYRSKSSVMPRKHSVEHVIMHNHFDSSGLLFANRRRTLLRTVARWVYYRFPAFVRRRLKPYLHRFEKKFYHWKHD
ncbi:MAG: hypothetical protein DWQ07_08730 [Chloroflexi bacterium]|nr:MAG: hypothetical protein DWQ07_08730 [Chloroflexota bacterium]MBL1193204.1 hypothetical protein [Chloroflexota bacterium]NOH10498.1 hypothetical protein [Chloroflexota bacterium]